MSILTPATLSLWHIRNGIIPKKKKCDLENLVKTSLGFMMNPALCNSVEVRSDAFHDVRTVAPCVLLRNYRKKHLYNANTYILTVSLITLAF